MDQIRLVLAVVLSILVFLVWDFFFMPDRPTPPAPSEQTAERSSSDRDQPYQSERAPLEQSGGKLTLPSDDSDRTGSDGKEVSARQSIALTVETPLYSLDISELGATFVRFDLKQYRESNQTEAPRKSLVSEHNQNGTLAFDLAGAEVDGISAGSYQCQVSTDQISVDSAPRAISFSRVTSTGVVIEKKYTFYPDSYLIGLDVLVKNGSDQALTGSPAVSLTRFFEGEGSRFVFEGPSAYVNHRLKEVKIKNIEDENMLEGPLSWVAVQNRYFLSSLIPEAREDNRLLLSTRSDRDENRLVTAQLQGRAQSVAPDTKTAFQYKVFIGPKNIRTLKSIGHNLDKAVNFGWFDVVARPCLWLMNHIYQLVPNYGIAIIVLTIIIKLIFWPLGNKSYKSMAEMKKIQPLMAEVREKYKDDKKKMNEEMMALYKTYKVNPLGGCLPMVVQIPVFIAFYRMLYQAIELRHTPFMLWIDDLSAPERLFSFDVAIPLMQPPTGIPVMTIIMGATMFLQQKLQPTPGDPTQAKMMMLMPLFLTVIFINFPSGLVLYFIVNNLVSIAQQHYVTRRNN